MYLTAAIAFFLVWHGMDPDETGDLRRIVAAVTVTFAAWAVVSFAVAAAVGHGPRTDDEDAHPSHG
jgi:hypothetical protein